MASGTPKQFLPLGAEGKPVLVHTVERFIDALPAGSPIVVVIAESELERWQHVARQWGVWERIGMCEGGRTRFESVKKGLQLIECHTVAIHDGVRPLVSAELINRAFELAERNGAAIPYVRPVDSFRSEDGRGGTAMCDRDSLVAIQTPQVFGYCSIRKAYDKPYDPRYTDDASVWGGELLPYMHMCEGERQNIKVTTPLDMVVAAALLEAGY